MYHCDLKAQQKGISAVKSKAKALRHFKVNRVMKIHVTFNSNLLVPSL